VSGLRATRRERSRLYAEQGGCCYYCGEACGLPFRGPAEGPIAPRIATLEHLTPRSLGGTNDGDNLCMACAACNQQWCEDVDTPAMHAARIIRRLREGRRIMRGGVELLFHRVEQSAMEAAS
jgi:5-methylcytosine-specific restriction endonuclease McrA